MKRADRTNISERIKTSFANSGRAAGIGALYDRYDEESGYRPLPKNKGRVRLLSDSLTQEEKDKLHGEIKIIKKR